MSKGLDFISGVGLGAALMYVLDPTWGRRRRALARDKMIHAARRAGDAVDATSRDLSNRTHGLWSEARAAVTPDGATDEVIEARVRARMGRVVSHPRAVDVRCQNGRVTLRGPILAAEERNLIRTALSVRGVESVDNELEVHERRDIPSLQGGVPRPGDRFELAQENWSPAARLLVSLGGGALAAFGAGRGGATGLGLGITGLGLVLRSLTNLELRRLTGVGGGRRAVDVQKTIQIHAPVEEVFAFWDNYENFPHFMRNVREVLDHGDGRSHWTVAGPAGTTVAWEAELTERIPNQLLAWKSVGGSSVAHAGLVRFTEIDEETTRVDIRMSYNPPAGAVGHAVASLFGRDPKHEMDEDMVRMKTMIETGNPPHDASQPIANGEQLPSPESGL